jgi:signal transduction histidine kinase
MSGVTLQPSRDLPLNTDDAHRIRRMLLRRMLVLPSALLLMVGGVVAHFYFAAVAVDPTDWMLVLLAVVGAGFSFAGYWMAADMAACLQLTDTETRQMRARLVQTGKMAELREMGTSIAHDINNPLQVMMSELALIRTITEDLEPVVPDHEARKMAMLRESTEVIGHQIKRCSNITQGLVNFSKETESSPPRAQ